MEITFDPSGIMSERETLEQIHLLSEKYQEIVPGAGTVLTAHQVEEARKAGADYIISPNTDVKVIAAAKKVQNARYARSTDANRNSECFFVWGGLCEIVSGRAVWNRLY